MLFWSPPLSLSNKLKTNFNYLIPIRLM